MFVNILLFAIGLFKFAKIDRILLRNMNWLTLNSQKSRLLKCCYVSGRWLTRQLDKEGGGAQLKRSHKLNIISRVYFEILDKYVEPLVEISSSKFPFPIIAYQKSMGTMYLALSMKADTLTRSKATNRSCRAYVLFGFLNRREVTKKTRDRRLFLSQHAPPNHGPPLQSPGERFSQWKCVIYGKQRVDYARVS